MSRGFPSMTALLGLLAVAVYQHRDKIAVAASEKVRPPVPGPAAPGKAASAASSAS